MSEPREVALAVASDLDVAAARRAARELAVGQGLALTEVEAIVTAVVELASNIVVHAGRGEIRLTPVEEKGRRGLLVVAEDAGPGIPDPARAMLDGYSTQGGLGLGLPSARRLADEFELLSLPGRGTTVRLKKWKAERLSLRVSGEATAAGGGAPFLLLVEDNPNDEFLALRALRKHQLPSRIEVVRDGAEALNFLFARGAHAGRDPTAVPRLILLDLKLPKLDGIEVLKQLRAHARTRLLPIVVLTSSAEERDRQEVYAAGANSYVRKPVDFVEFAEVVRQLGFYWLSLNQPPPQPR